MTEDELFGAMDALWAADFGATDSGVKDEDLRARVQATLASMSEEARRLALSHFARNLLDDDMLIAGYGIEDVASFLRWLDDRMGIHL